MRGERRWLARTMSDNQSRFSGRKRLLTVRQDAMEVAAEIWENLVPEREAQLRAILDGLHPADLADAMLFLAPDEEKAVFNLLDPSEAAEVLDEVDATTEANLLRGTSANRIADILEELPSDEGADVVGGLDQQERTMFSR